MGSEPSIRTEVKIPGLLRSLDILVELESGERIAILESISEADHDHLTRALAYAVGWETNTVIVVAESHRPEFVAVAQYLNAAGLAYEDHGDPGAYCSEDCGRDFAWRICRSSEVRSDCRSGRVEGSRRPGHTGAVFGTRYCGLCLSRAASSVTP